MLFRSINKAVAYSMPFADGYEGKSVLLVGDQPCAADVIAALSHLSRPPTITLVTPRERTKENPDPLPLRPDDPLPERAKSIAAANALVRQGAITWSPGVWVEAVERQDDESVLVRFSGEREDQQRFDAVIGQTGYRLDWGATSELQLDICPITDAPRPFSNYLLQRPSPYSIEYPAPDPAALITSEPNYYVLGAKSFGRMPGFLYQHGLRQIRDVFTIIGDRATLDLYAQ